MAEQAPCPRCSAPGRLSVVYYDASGNIVGGHCQCPDCGPRHAEPIRLRRRPVSKKLLEKKAS